MKNTIMAPLALILCLGISPTFAAADDRPVIEAFYKMLSNPAAEDIQQQSQRTLADSWESIGNYSGKHKTREKFVKQLGGFGKLIPDLNWSIEDIIVQGDQYVVRGRATGTPTGPFFGVDGKGNSFDIMSIDIHTVSNGKIIRSYHIEDWAGAIRQLKKK